MEEYRKARQAASDIAQDAFKEYANILFSNHPELKSFGWTQYTPYFNDGDECVFSANIESPHINDIRYDTWGDKVYGLYEDEDDEETNSNEISDELVMKVVAFLRNFDDDILKEIFGDHVEITVMPDRIDVSEYNHD